MAPSTRPEDVRLLGLLLSELGRHKDALPIWQRLASRNLLTTDTRRLIDCAARLGRDDVILEVCGDLRRAGVEDPELVSYEASILQPYDPEGAASVLQRYVAKHPEDRAARLHLSALGLQLHKEDLVAVAKEAIPTPSEVPSRNWPLVVRVMAEVSSPENILRYAYKLLREQFSEPDPIGRTWRRFCQWSTGRYSPAQARWPRHSRFIRRRRHRSRALVRDRRKSRA